MTLLLRFMYVVNSGRIKVDQEWLRTGKVTKFFEFLIKIISLLNSFGLKTSSFVSFYLIVLCVFTGGVSVVPDQGYWQVKDHVHRRR